jgi:hypothetical protein
VVEVNQNYDNALTALNSSMIETLNSAKQLGQYMGLNRTVKEGTAKFLEAQPSKDTANLLPSPLYSLFLAAKIYTDNFPESGLQIFIEGNVQEAREEFELAQKPLHPKTMQSSQVSLYKDFPLSVKIGIPITGGTFTENIGVGKNCEDCIRPFFRSHFSRVFLFGRSWDSDPQNFLEKSFD